MSEIIHRSKTRPVRVGNLTIGGSDELIHPKYDNNKNT